MQAYFHRRALACGSRTWTSLSVVTCLCWWVQGGGAESPTQAALCVHKGSRSASITLGNRQLGDAQTQVSRCQYPGCRGRPHRRRVGCPTPQPKGNSEARGALARGTLCSGLPSLPKKGQVGTVHSGAGEFPLKHTEDKQNHNES